MLTLNFFVAVCSANKNSGGCHSFCCFNVTPKHKPTISFGVPVVESSLSKCRRKNCSIGTSEEMNCRFDS